MARIVALVILVLVSVMLRWGFFQAFAMVCFAAVINCRSLNRNRDTLIDFLFSKEVTGSGSGVLPMKVERIQKISA